MLIDFHCLEETVIKNFYGGEKDTRAKMFTDDLHHHIMYSRLAPGASIWVHRHDRGSEIIHILQGSGKACYDENHAVRCFEGRVIYLGGIPEGLWNGVGSNEKSLF